MMSDASYSQEGIAVIGMAGRFPHSPNLESFWKNIEQGNELISFFSDQELLESGIDSLFLNHPHYVKAKGILADIDCFDADLFGYSPKEAAYMDPQQRILLECAWETFEHAGYYPEQYRGSIGVFVGGNASSYFLSHLFPHQKKEELIDELSILIGNGHDYLASRISYKFDLKGPAQTIQTACSTSLVTVHQACQSLLNYECDMALAGGVSVTVPQKCGYLYMQEGIYSPDGHCRAFDQKAAGTVFGDGVGLVLLKRLEDAVADRDTIHAIIKGSASNNDGRSKVGFLAPSVEGQARVIAAAQTFAGIHPEKIAYIEAHGTGTALGDPIEVSALTQAFRLKTERKQFCALGSVKTNVGHLITAAGIASLIKTILCLKYRKIPPTVHFETANPKIDFAVTPFYINRELQEWKSSIHARYAGVSSFGLGGINAHLVLEEAPKQDLDVVIPQEMHILPFSAKTEDALKLLLKAFCSTLIDLPYALGNIAYTLQMGRKALDKRIYFICKTKEQAVDSIRNYLTTHSLASQEGPDFHFLNQLGSNWLKGQAVNWVELHLNKKRSRVPLPTAIFAKKRFWIDPPTLNSSLSIQHNSQNHSFQPSAQKIQHPIESLVFQVWQNILQLHDLNCEDNFFALGGDSLLALEIVDQLRQYFHVHLLLQDLFHHPTVRTLSECIAQKIENRP